VGDPAAAGASSSEQNRGMEIRIEGRELPGEWCAPGPDAPSGHTRVRVGVQRRNNPSEILDPVPGDAAEAEWTIDCKIGRTDGGVDITGPYVQGRPGGRFIYLSWLSDQGPGPCGMFRRGKIRLDALPESVVSHALTGGPIAVRVQLTDDRGGPACATIGPPAVAWRIA
jgi:hypothetical protein